MALNLKIARIANGKKKRRLERYFSWKTTGSLGLQHFEVFAVYPIERGIKIKRIGRQLCQSMSIAEARAKIAFNEEHIVKRSAKLVVIERFHPDKQNWLRSLIGT